MLRLCTTLLLALFMFANSAMIVDTAYFCLIDNQVRSDCCSEFENSQNDDCDQQNLSNCCEVLLTQTEYPPARAETDQPELQQIPVVAQLALLTKQPYLPQAHASFPTVMAPHGTGPPLFIRNCSFLI